MRKLITLLSVLLLYSSVFAQTHTVIGRVLDENGKPIPFASIRVKGSRGGVAADQDGAFSVHAPAGAVLVITATAYDAAEAKVPASGQVTVSLRPKNAALEDVVVTAYGVQRQARELGYSTSKVTSKDLTVAQPISAVNGLTGKVAGLQINTTNNQVFAPTRITLRGARSLTGNNQPLIIVDGAIFYADIASINPNDIVDMNILKGASAAAVYGSDASNGVIMITTRKGTRGRPTINFTTTTQVETVSYMPKFQTRFGSDGGERWVNDFNDLSDNVPYENQQYGPEFRAGAVVPIGRVVYDGTYLTVPYVANPNQKKDFFNHALTTQNNLSYSAGDENSRFYLSAQDVNTAGVMPMDKGRRDAFRIGGSRTYGKFTAEFTGAYTYKYETQSANDGTVYDDLINTPTYIPLGMLKNWQSYKFATPDGYYNDYYNNPYWYLANDRTNTSTNTITGDMHLNLHPWSWLNLSYRLSLNDIYGHNTTTGNPETFSEYSDTSLNVYYSNPAGNGVILSRGEGTKFIAQSPSQASYSTWTDNNMLLTSDFLASFDKNVSKDINLKFNVGTTYVDNKIVNTYINAGPLFFPVFNVNSLTGIATYGSSASTAGNGGNYNIEAKKLGFFGDGTFGYKNLAFIHGSYRSDIDSRLSNSNRFIPYYDIDGSFVISDMIPTLFSRKGLNFLKVHGAHSLTGNASALASGSQFLAVGAYATVPTLQSASGFPFNGLGGYQLNQTIANPNIKPEQVVENEAGLEMGFLNNRFNFGVTGYVSTLTNGIVYAPIPYSSGFTTALVNAAHTQNKGLEFELKGDVYKSKNWEWFLNVNYTHTHSNVIGINGTQPSLAVPGSNSGNSYAVVNHPFPVIEGYDWTRDSAGQVIVDPVTGMPTRSNAIKILGNATPTDILGFTTFVTYKAWTLTVTADYRGGYKIFNQIGEAEDFSGAGYTTSVTGRQRFVFPNSVYLNAQGQYVKNTNITVDDANFNFWPSLYNSVSANYVTSAAAWKLREVAITYEIPHRWVSATKVVQHATLTLSGRNLLMIRPKTNQWTDPEFNNDTGNDIGENGEGNGPPTRIFSGTLSVTF